MFISFYTEHHGSVVSTWEAPEAITLTEVSVVFRVFLSPSQVNPSKVGHNALIGTILFSIHNHCTVFHLILFKNEYITIKWPNKRILSCAEGTEI
jgi:hypothetical protein